MRQSAFAAPGEFFKGNIHTHSNVSDGVLDPAEVCRRYADAGYDFISLTDHFVGRFDYPITDTTNMRTNAFTTILGAELHSGANSCGELWHILAVGLPADFTPPNSPGYGPLKDQESGPQIAARAAEAGAFVALAHPHWSGLSEEDALSLEAAHSVEVYNHGCDVECDRGYGLETLDKLLASGRRVNLCATDDAHFETPDHFGGWVVVKAQANEPSALLEALKNGHHYSSQGPDFCDIVWENDHVTIECSPVTTIVVQGCGSGTAQKVEAGQTRVQLPLERLEKSPWARVSIIDGAGKRAWANPVWRDGRGWTEGPYPQS